MEIDSILKPFQRFGVHLGLERIQRLLADLGNPHHSVPVIHVAGTNGKGSVCAYLSAVLTEAGYRVGRYTSPHLIDWTERICINEQPISSETLGELLLAVQDAIRTDTETPTQFEVITAAAWLYFAQQQVDVAVVEVGLGGRLDATNVCDRPLVSIITSISREHWQQLGPTLADIATEKAGILKPGCPAVVGLLPPEAKAVIAQKIAQLGCPAVWPQPARQIGEGWAEYQGIKYPLPLLGDIQLINSALAIAALQILCSQGWKISEQAIAAGMAKTNWPGRLQWTTWKNHRLLIDGAHNPAAAQALRQYVDTCGVSVTWVMGMLSTKDHAEIFKALLQSGDRLYLVPVPDHSSADPEHLATLAGNICPQLGDRRTFPNLTKGLEAATSTATAKNLLVLCGSLYLVGYFLKQVMAHDSYEL
ncbi:MAG: bifunctional folylpolyglutamate synthase/dihydrofolate synthase [Aphanothece sp. CMT-3BRIN-NPC111]|nr:bifunctional folylpolyglutamate synthase/dihydrofolate synthase [Aphanothece sp. CMT-3BRIN-NPC111]